MITKQKITACISMIGQYGIQYPNQEAEAITIPEGTTLIKLSWVNSESWRAFTWERDSDTMVVWIEERNL